MIIFGESKKRGKGGVSGQNGVLIEESVGICQGDTWIQLMSWKSNPAGIGVYILISPSFIAPIYIEISFYLNSYDHKM